MKISNELNLQLKQKLSLSHDMLLSLELIQLPLLDLRARIEKELLENPALEVSEKRQKGEQSIDKIEDSFSGDEDFFEDSSSANINTGVSPTSSSIDLKRNFLEGVISYKETLSDYLLEQLKVQNLSGKQREIGKIIISLIDEDGFFKEKLEEVFSEEELPTARDVLEIIQLFDPPGIASSSVKNALLFQIESMKKSDIDLNAYSILKNYFDLMVTRKDNEIKKRLKISNDDVKKAFVFLGKLNPYPGRAIASSQIKYILPDAYVYKRDNSLVLEMNNDVIPSLTINRYIQKILVQSQKKKKLNSQEKYVAKKVQGGRQFINLLNYRKSSLSKLVLMIVKEQEEFFFKGPKYLKPLTMKTISEEIGLSESTVSRLASSKYIQTEWGLHEIKYFFSNNVGAGTDSASENKSSESVRELIKEIVAKEHGKKISDQKIADLLEKQGVKIARRTVAKYRKMLDILPSYHRKL